MRIKDIVNEAISVTQYEQTVIDALHGALKASISYLAHYSLGNELTAVLSDDDSSDFPVRDYLEKFITNHLKQEVPIYLKNGLRSVLGDQAITNIYVEPIGRDAAFVHDRAITLDDSPVRKMASRSAEVLMDILYDNYSTPERAKGLYKTAEQIGNGDRFFWGEIYYKIDKIVEKYASTIIHELVHIVQHNAQHNKGLRHRDYEYRSYLDKQKGEFQNYDRGNRDERYWNLYLSSPQEIAAFAHEAALKLVKDYSFHEIESPEGFYKIDPEDLVSYIDQITSNRFKQPKTRQEQSVRKRYIKLVYQEVQRYINARIASFQKKSTVK